jgi:hypothetical protein
MRPYYTMSKPPPLALKYLRMLKPYSPLQIKQKIFNSCLETQQDGAVEAYEFIDVMRIIEANSGKSLLELSLIIKEIRTGVVSDPKNVRFGMTSTLELPELSESRRLEYKTAFKFLSKINSDDGVITVDEIIKAVALYA